MELERQVSGLRSQENQVRGCAATGTMASVGAWGGAADRAVTGFVLTPHG